MKKIQKLIQEDHPFYGDLYYINHKKLGNEIIDYKINNFIFFPVSYQ